MFSGIIEQCGEVAGLETEGSNLVLQIRSGFTSELKVDQSVSHNGVCLTVESIEGDVYRVSAVDETLQKTNLGSLKTGDSVNLERCLRIGDRLDGHMVQGHVDDTAECLSIEEKDGSWLFQFGFDTVHSPLIVEKGSIALNGISLTVFNVEDDCFRVAIIPYTYEHTNLKNLKVGEQVNLEFDVLGKYVSKLLKG